jgi:hypothetical protein
VLNNGQSNEEGSKHVADGNVQALQGQSLPPCSAHSPEAADSLQGRSTQQSPKASMLASETKVVKLILLTANGTPQATEVNVCRQQWVAK